MTLAVSVRYRAITPALALGNGFAVAPPKGDCSVRLRAGVLVSRISLVWGLVCKTGDAGFDSRARLHSPAVTANRGAHVMDRRAPIAIYGSAGQERRSVRDKENLKSAGQGEPGLLAQGSQVAGHHFGRRYSPECLSDDQERSIGAPYRLRPI